LQFFTVTPTAPAIAMATSGDERYGSGLVAVSGMSSPRLVGVSVRPLQSRVVKLSRRMGASSTVSRGTMQWPCASPTVGAGHGRRPALAGG
jgi:hypothetical protein